MELQKYPMVSKGQILISVSGTILKSDESKFVTISMKFKIGTIFKTGCLFIQGDFQVGKLCRKCKFVLLIPIYIVQHFIYLVINTGSLRCNTETVINISVTFCLSK